MCGFHMTSHNISDYNSKQFWIMTLPSFFIPKLCEPALTWARWPSCYRPWLVHSDPRPLSNVSADLPPLIPLWYTFLSSPVYLLTPVKCLMRYETIACCTWGPLEQHFTPALFILYHTVQQSWLFSPGQPREQKLWKCKRERVWGEAASSIRAHRCRFTVHQNLVFKLLKWRQFIWSSLRLVVRQAHIFTSDRMNKSSFLLMLLVFTNLEIPDGFVSLIAQQLWASTCPTQLSQLISALCLEIMFPEVAPKNIDTAWG